MSEAKGMNIKMHVSSFRNELSKKREFEFDLLRIISAIAVVSIHIISGFRTTIAKDFADSLNVWKNSDAAIVSILDALPRFAVPCFLMLTGAFLFADEETYEPDNYYVTKFRSSGIHFGIFILFSILFQVVFIIVGENHGDIVELIKNLVFGSPFYHMWYVFMYIGIIALVPFFAGSKELWQNKIGYRFAVIYLIWSSLSVWLSDNTSVKWHIGLAFCYFSYVIMGYFIKKRASKNNLKAFRDIFSGILLECLAGIMVYWHIIHGIDEIDLSSQYTEPFCPIIVIASVLIFKGFSEINLDIQITIRGISLYCLIIYLIHPFVWEVFKKILYHMKGEIYIGPDKWGLMYIVYFLIVLFFSSLFSCIYIRIYYFLSNRRIFTIKN